MKKLTLGALVVLMVAPIALPIAAADDDKAWSADGMVRARWDTFRNYIDTDPNEDENFDLWPYRAILGVEGSFSSKFKGRVDLQATGWFGDTPNPARPYLSGNDQYVNVELYQAYATFVGSNWDFTLGRREHTLGNELHIGDVNFYNGQSFDGFDAQGNYDSWNLDLFFYQTQERSVTSVPGISTAANDVWFSGISSKVNLPLASYIEPYILNLRDGANGIAHMNFYTYGLLWKRPRVDESGWDLSFEIAGQTGTAAGAAPGSPEVDAAGLIMEGWFGWTFAEAHRVHVGYLWASGDDGTDPTTNDAWMPLFEDPHAYNRLGNLDLFASALSEIAGIPVGGGLTNVQDISIGYGFNKAGSAHHGLLAVHSLSFVEVAAGADDDIGIEYDLVYQYDRAENAVFELGFSYLTAGDAWGPDREDINRIWAQISLDWGRGDADSY